MTSSAPAMPFDRIPVAGKRVLVRADFNVPMHDGAITDATRIERTLPTIKALVDAGAKVVLCSHLGRPKGKIDEALTLAPVAEWIERAMGQPVKFSPVIDGAYAQSSVDSLFPGQIVLLENLRFHAGEEANDPAFIDVLASLADVYVNDAFSAAHRAHASTEGIAHRLPSMAGLSMAAELAALESALGAPARPVLAVVGGAKVSTKLAVLKHLVNKVDVLLLGGAMANTFLVAQGHDVGKSLAEPDMADEARAIQGAADSAGCELLLPVDMVAADRFGSDAIADIVPATAIPADRMALDVGPATVAAAEAALAKAATVLWNGPMGAFETPPFDAATVAVARAVAGATTSGAVISVAGGGDTVAALGHAGVTDQFTYVSTAGGAFLEWMEGRVLPGVAALG